MCGFDGRTPLVLCSPAEEDDDDYEDEEEDWLDDEDEDEYDDEYYDDMEVRVIHVMSKCVL